MKLPLDKEGTAMSIRNHSIALAGSFALLGFAAVASAQDLGALKDAVGGGGDMSSLTSGTAGNAAGVIEFCIKNNYLGGDAASSMKDQLIGKLGGPEKAEQDTGYTDGAKGLLTGGDGKSMNLADSGGLKEKLTKKACESVLEHAKSFL